MTLNASLAGLVGITAPCAVVDSIGACVVGVVAGILVCVFVPFIDRRGVDDPVGASSVHGICGAWGVIAVGLLANPEILSTYDAA